MALERAKQFKVLLSDEEVGKLEHLADERSMTASDLLRFLLHREHAAAAVPPFERDRVLAQAVKEQLQQPDSRPASVFAMKK